MLVTSLQPDYWTRAKTNNNTMVRSVDMPVFYHNRISAMADELLSLKWNNHKSTFADVLSVLRDQEVFVDVTLACGGKLYPAHKFVLSTCSEYFREMFTKTPCKHPIVYMKDVNARDLEALLDFMYRGEVNVPQMHLSSLIQTAEGLQIKGLAVPDEQMTPSYIRRNRELSTPRPPPAPSVSPPPKRKRTKEDNYTPVGALNMMYTNMSPQEPNSPYDLSQKSSSSSSVSQSDAVHNDRAHSTSPHQPRHPSSATSSVSPYRNKENSPEDARGTSRSPEDSIKHSRSPPPGSTTPRPASAATAEVNGRDSLKKEDSDPLPGPSGMHLKNSDEETEEDPVTERQDIKEDITVDDDDEENEWVMGNGLSEGGDTTSGGTTHPHPECHPFHHSETSNSSLPSLDPALGGYVSFSQSYFDSTSNKLQCPICSKDFKTMGSLKRHYRAHINFKPFVCHLCGKRFTLNQYLIEHRRTHTGERPYSCQMCGKCFAQTGTLYHHVRNVHQKDLSSKSRGDNVGYLSPRSHSAGPPHISGSLLLPPRPLWPQDGNIADEILTCPICNKRFPKKRKSNLQVHMRTHTGERPFKCQQCGRGFKQKAHLEKHQEKSCHVMSEYVPYPFFPKI